MNWIKKLFSKKQKHWTDDWDKATYRISKHSNDNGWIGYYVFRELHNKEKLLNTSAYPNLEAANMAVKIDKEFYKKEWNSRYTSKVEYIEYKEES